jgi:hypothetical protein
VFRAREVPACLGHPMILAVEWHDCRDVRLPRTLGMLPWCHACPAWALLRCLVSDAAASHGDAVSKDGPAALRGHVGRMHVGIQASFR